LSNLRDLQEFIAIPPRMLYMVGWSVVALWSSSLERGFPCRSWQEGALDSGVDGCTPFWALPALRDAVVSPLFFL